MIKVGLAGNPNVGKSVIFNNLTGSRQHIGNWPGKTVEKKEGYARCNGDTIYIIDLPGSYSLTAYSPEEIITREYIINDKPDVVVAVVDASNLERNLYLVLQLMELGINLVVDLNKIDLAELSGQSIDVKMLEKLLGVPIVPTIAPKKIGLNELCEKILEIAKFKKISPKIKYSREAQGTLEKIVSILERYRDEFRDYYLVWLAIKFLEKDPIVEEIIRNRIGKNAFNEISIIRRKFEEKHGNTELYMINERYRVIQDIVSKVVRGERKLTVSDILDYAFLDKYLGIPVFLSILWILFQFTFIVSTPFIDLVGDAFAFVSENLEGITGNAYLDYLFFGDYGILNGIGMILSFVPLIMTLYFALSLFEDFGYMARAAFLMDKAMRKIGMTGRTIIPMILGFGCNVAGIYGTRIIPEEEDRIVAIITNPLMMCSARLAAFSILVQAFWQANAGSVLLSLYILGILLAVAISLLLKKTVFKERVSPFIMELPPYQFPSIKNAFSEAWNRGSLFFKKAGTIILVGLLVIGVLSTVTIDMRPARDIEESVIAMIGEAFSPIFKPLGWDWRLVVAIIFGFVAKEIVIGATAMLYGVPEEEFATFIANNYDPLTIYGYMIFVLVYVPCIASLAAIKHETGSWKWVIFTVIYEVLLAYVLNLLVVSFGRILFGWYI